MRGKLTLLAGVCAGAIAFPAFAQDAAEDTSDGTEIIVTAQRTAEKLQDVPIAVSAFNAEALEKQQIKNTSDLQLSLPNITFTKTNFTGSSFTIRGIGDLCVGVTCDQATAIHMNDAPLFGTRLFESEFYDLAQIEVLRGPQGTLYGRNATSGVVNIRTAKASLSGIAANAEAEYGNYNGMKFKGMVNVPVGENVAVRVAGFYLNRDGYTQNTFLNKKVDDRDMYGLRGSLHMEPGSTTKIDFVAQYFHERDSRMRAQKGVCQRDTTGVLGCLNSTRDFNFLNANSTFVGVLTSKELIRIKTGSAALGNLFGLGSLYGPDAYQGTTNPADYRKVYSDFEPRYFTDELILQGTLEQDLGGGLDLKVEGNYQKVKVDSMQDYNNAVQNRAVMQPALNNLAIAATPVTTGSPLNAFGLPVAYFAPLANALMPNGPSGVLCTSLPEETGTGVFGGHKYCSMTPQDFDRSNQDQSSWSTEAIISSKWDGPFNFLLGGIYGKFHLNENSYYVDSFGIDYLTGLLGTLTAMGAGAPPSYLGTPTYRNNSADLKINTYGIFGEAYYKFSDTVKLTLGIRYNHDEKNIQARTTLANYLVPFTATNGYDTTLMTAGNFDADAGIAGNQLWQYRTVKFGEWTGRAVIDWNITPDNLVYASYSRGYKSGGINPPLSPVFSVPESFKPEFVNAFEIGSKNTFANGKVTLNLTAFYYDYKDLQLSRIVARTSVNDNVNAEIYGLEAEAVLRPTRELTINMNASYLHAKVNQDKLLANPRDFGGGRADAVIIKDITNGANCAVAPNVSGNAAGTQALVTLINGSLGLNGPTSFGANSGIASTGAFGICSAIGGAIAAPSAGLRTVFATPTGPLPFTLYSSGITSNLKGNTLPGAPDYKFSAGVQYAAPVGDLTVTPRVDFIYTGKSYGNIFNGAVNAVPSFTQVNAQLQVDGTDKKWFARVWVQNLMNKDSITGLYVTDQSSGNFTNVFTLEPRRYGITAGIKF